MYLEVSANKGLVHGGVCDLVQRVDWAPRGVVPKCRPGPVGPLLLTNKTTNDPTNKTTATNTPTNKTNKQYSPRLSAELCDARACETSEESSLSIPRILQPPPNNSSISVCRLQPVPSRLSGNSSIYHSKEQDSGCPRLSQAATLAATGCHSETTRVQTKHVVQYIYIYI